MRKNRKGINYPNKYMKLMKKAKNKKIRQLSVYFKVKEQLYNNAERVL